MTLHDHQIEIVDETRALLRAGTKSAILVSPTGSGKTCIAAHLLKSASEKNLVSWFLCHRREILDQSSETFHAWGVPHGIAANGYPENRNQRVQIGSIQTMARRYTRYRAPQLIIFDEAHHCAASTWSKLYDMFPSAFKIGLSATPQRLDARGLEKFFSTMVLGKSVSWLIENGFLSKYKLFAPPGISVEGVAKRAGDFALEQLAIAADKPSITGNAIHEYKKHCYGKRAIVFCVSVAHSQHVVAQFRAAGIAAEHVDGETNKWQRQMAVQAFRDGRIQILSNCELFSEGFSVDAVEAVISLRPTASLGIYLQQMGRALRRMEGKTHATILDLAGNVYRHGLPDDDREWSLKGVRPNKNAEKEIAMRVRSCPRCYATQRAGSMTCNYCGAQFTVAPREVEEKEGELVEVDLKKIQIEKKTEQAKAKTLEDLINLGITRYGEVKGPRWADYVYKAREAKEKNRQEEKAERERDQTVRQGP